MLLLELMMQVGLFVAVLVFVQDMHWWAAWNSNGNISAKYCDDKIAALDRAIEGDKSAYRDFEIACASEAMFFDR